jgi:outer membrane protein
MGTTREVRAHVLAVVRICSAVAGLGMGCGGAHADTLEWALVQAYQNNPSLNAQRASLRATDKSVPQPLSGKLNLAATGGHNDQSATSAFPLGGVLINSPFAQSFYSRTIGANGTYTLFNGFQTANRAPQAESPVDAARETYRVTEQQVLLDAATVYMNLLRDGAVLDLQRRNVEVLTKQLKQTRDRFNVGEVTRTDVVQAESRLAARRSQQLLAAQSQYVTSRANYRRVIGVEPGKLAPGTPVDRLSPNVLANAIAQGQAQSPSVLAAAYGVDVAELAVKISDGALYPNLMVTGYQGGGEYSAVRQFKETLDQQRLNLDVNRDQARATVLQSWGGLDAAKAQVESTTARVNAAENALNGVREEARVGQRTTLDVLNAQQELVNARVALVTAQHGRVVASYTLLAAVGALSMQRLGLNVQIYDPMVHYQQVRDAWVGLRLAPQAASSSPLQTANTGIPQSVANLLLAPRAVSSSLLRTANTTIPQGVAFLLAPRAASSSPLQTANTAIPQDIANLLQAPRAVSSSPLRTANTTIAQGIADLIQAPKPEEKHIASHVPRWVVWLAADLSESKAWALYHERLSRFASLIGDRQPVVLFRELPGMGHAKRYVIALADEDRAPLDKFCEKLTAAGSTCDVMRNEFGL